MTTDLHTRMRDAFASMKPRRLPNGKTPREMEIFEARYRAMRRSMKLRKKKPWWKVW